TLKSIRLAGLINNRNTLSPEEESEIGKLRSELIKSCEIEAIPSRNGHSCINYWLQFGRIEKVREAAGLKIGLSDYNLLNISELNFPHSYERRLLRLLAKHGDLTSNIIHRMLDLASLQSSEGGRLLIWQSICSAGMAEATNYMTKLKES